MKWLIVILAVAGNGSTLSPQPNVYETAVDCEKALDSGQYKVTAQIAEMIRRGNVQMIYDCQRFVFVPAPAADASPVDNPLATIPETPAATEQQQMTTP
jgi:hypothetical protein